MKIVITLLMYSLCVSEAKWSEVDKVKWFRFGTRSGFTGDRQHSTAQHSTARLSAETETAKKRSTPNREMSMERKKKVDHAQQFDGRASERAANLSRAYTFYCPRNYGPPSQQKLLLAVNFEKQPWIICKGRGIDRLSTYVFLWRIEMESFVIYAKIAHFSP